MTRSSLGLLAVLALAGCLDPLTSDEIDLDRIFGDPTIDPDQLPHVEDNPDLQSRLGLFPSELPYLKGFTKGRGIWYWDVPGPNSDFIVPYYVVVEASGAEQRPIIDAIPGDGGYSPWWRRFVVRTTAKYAGERIWSRAAVDAGVKAGILEPPEETTLVVTCPVVRRTARVQVDKMGAEAAPSWVYYRNQRVSWVPFSDAINVDVGVRRMPTAALYVLRRVNEPLPLHEQLIGIDLDGDDKLLSTNNIFAAGPGEPGYSALWYTVGVRTVADYVSIDTVTASTTIGLTDEAQFLGPNYDVVISDLVVPPLDVDREALRICPIQTAMGSL